MYIPCFLKVRHSSQVPTAATVYPPPEVSSFTLQLSVDPKKIIQKFKQFKFNKFMNEFGFCDEYGAEYIVHCFRNGDDKVQSWATVVTIADSLDPVTDINKFFYWLHDNFKIDSDKKRGIHTRSKPVRFKFYAG